MKRCMVKYHAALVTRPAPMYINTIVETMRKILRFRRDEEL